MNKVNCTIKIINSNCDNQQIPAYNHILIEDKIFLIKNPIIVPSILGDNEDTYVSINAMISGKVSKERGYFPNPMVEFDVFFIEEIIVL